MSTARGNGETRGVILDATDRLLAARGFRKLTMDDIAAEAGVSRRTIYMYFPSKEEVGLSSIDRVVEATHERLLELAGGVGDPAETLRRMLVERILRRIDSVHAYRTSLDELFEAVRPAYMARRRKHLEREAEILAGVLGAGRARGRFEIDDPAAAAKTMVLATNAFLPYSLSVQELGQRGRIEAGIRRMADMLLKSVVAGPPAATRAPRDSKRNGGRSRRAGRALAKAGGQP